MEKMLSKFDIYDIIGYFVPGFLLFGTLSLIFKDIFNTEFVLTSGDGFIKSLSVIILSYFMGILTHEFSEIVTVIIFKIWGGQPSERFLLSKDKKYSLDFKNKIKSCIMKEYSITLNDNKKQNQEVFNLIYSKVQKLEGKDRIQLFNSIFGMCRNLYASSFLCVVIFTIKAYLEYKSNNFYVDIVYILFFIISGLLLLRRCKRFSERFVDYVYRDFCNCMISKDSNTIKQG